MHNPRNMFGTGTITHTSHAPSSKPKEENAGPLDAHLFSLGQHRVYFSPVWIRRGFVRLPGWCICCCPATKGPISLRPTSIAPGGTRTHPSQPRQNTNLEQGRTPASTHHRSSQPEQQCLTILGVPIGNPEHIQAHLRWISKQHVPLLRTSQRCKPAGYFCYSKPAHASTEYDTTFSTAAWQIHHHLPGRAPWIIQFLYLLQADTANGARSTSVLCWMLSHWFGREQTCSPVLCYTSGFVQHMNGDMCESPTNFQHPASDFAWRGWVWNLYMYHSKVSHPHIFGGMQGPCG